MAHNKTGIQICIIALIFTLLGCDVQKDSVSARDLKDIKHQQNIQKQQLEQLEKQQSQLINDFTLVVKSVQNVDRQQQAQTFTEFNPAQTRYFILNNGSIGLAGRILSIAPSEGGSIVNVSLVNLLSVPISNVGFRVIWGGARPTNPNEIPRWRQLLFSNEMNSNLLLPPGEWRNVSLILKGVSPNNLGYIKMSIAMENIIFDSEDRPGNGNIKPDKKQKK